MDNFVLVGKIINTFGIKGELKVLSDFEYLERVFVPGGKIYVGEEKELLVIKSHRIHKNYHLLLFDNYFNINDVLIYKGKKIYVAKNDLSLEQDEYLLQELIGYEVYDNDKLLGVIIDYMKTPQSVLFKVKGEKVFYLPNISEYIDYVDKENKKIMTKQGSDLVI